MADAIHATILETKVLCKQPGRYIGWPTICRRHNGELLVVFSGDRDQHVCPWGKVQMIRSMDNGRTWSAPETVCNTPLDDRDAGIIETKSGALVVAWFTSVTFEKSLHSDWLKGLESEPVLKQWEKHAEKITLDLRERYLGYWTVRSEDCGHTWQDPVRTRGSAPHGCIQLMDGRLLYVGRRSPQKNTALTVEESRDDGRSWQQIASVHTPMEAPETQMHEPHVVETVDGRLIAQFRFHYHDQDGVRDDKQSYMYQAISEDGGKTWTSAEKTTLLGYPPHLIRLHNGWLLSVYARRFAPYGEYACISRDWGDTWETDEEIFLSEGMNGDLGYPASVQLEDETILTVYYQKEKEDEKTCLMATHWKIEEI